MCESSGLSVGTSSAVPPADVRADAYDMELSAQVSSLRHVLADVNRVVPEVPSLIAYGAVMMQVSAGVLACTASDGDTTVTRRIAVPGAVDGQVLVTAGPLVKYLTKVTQNATLKLRVDDHGDVVIEVPGEGSYTFRSLNAAFPTPRKPERGLTPVPLDQLAGAVRAVAHAAAGAVQLSCSDSGITLAATDGYRIGHAVLPGGGAAGQGVVDVKALIEASRYQLTQIGIDGPGRVLRCVGTDVSFSTRLQDTVFPDVSQMVGVRPAQRAVVDRPAFERALGRLLAVAERTPLRITLASTSLAMRAENVERGSGVEELTLTSPSSDFEFGVNGAFLRDAIAAHTAEQVEVSWTGPLKPVYVRSQSGFVLTTLLMPVRL
jgi:DNA polymerase III sliding clamp (beta) subunit (PCNA family)